MGAVDTQFLRRKAVPLRDGPRKESLLSISCGVGWNVMGEVVSMPGGSPGMVSL